MKDTLTCWICGEKNKIVTWLDAVKYKDKCFKIKSKALYVPEEDCFDLNYLTNKVIDTLEKHTDYNSKIDKFELMSMNINVFTPEDVQKLQFGDGDWGGKCKHCGGQL